MMPMIALSVVVLPTPLRPSKVTTSPARTSKLTPCRTCDSPYQACRSFTVRSAAISGMAGPQIGFAYRRIGRHRLVIALREHPPAGEHGDAVAQIGNDAQIVLDHEHGAIRRRCADERADPHDIFAAHAGRRLIEQQQRWTKRQRRRELER